MPPVFRGGSSPETTMQGVSLPRPSSIPLRGVSDAEDCAVRHDPKTPYTAHRGHGINASILTPHQEKDGASLLAQQAQFQKPLNSHCCLAVFLGLPRYCWFQA